MPQRKTTPRLECLTQKKRKTCGKKFSRCRRLVVVVAAAAVHIPYL
jgi:hypothetical protein